MTTIHTTQPGATATAPAPNRPLALDERPPLDPPGGPFGYVMAAAPKLSNDPRILSQFAGLGIGAAGMHRIGGLELAGTVGLLVPRLCGLAALAFVALMIGVVAVTVMNLGAVDAIVPTAFLAVAAVLAWTRRDRTARLAAPVSRRLH